MKATPMNCELVQQHISESLDHGPNLSLPESVQRHLANCAECRAFESSVTALDENLAFWALRSNLPQNFATQILARAAQARAQSLTPAEIARRRNELDHQFRAAEAALRRRYLIPQSAVFLWIAFCAAVGWGLAEIAQAILDEAHRPLTGTASLDLLLLNLLLAATFLATGILLAKRPRLLLRLARFRR